MPRGDGTGPMKGRGAGCGGDCGSRRSAGEPGWGAEERDRALNLFVLNAAQKHPASAASPAFNRNVRNAEALMARA